MRTFNLNKRAKCKFLLTIFTLLLISLILKVLLSYFFNIFILFIAAGTPKEELAILDKTVLSSEIVVNGDPITPFIPLKSISPLVKQGNFSKDGLNKSTIFIIFIIN